MEIKSKYKDIYVTNTNEGFSAVTSIDFGGANVEFGSGYFSYKTTIKSITNGVITNTKFSGFRGDSALTTFNCSFPNLTTGAYLFCDCGLTELHIDLPKLSGDAYYMVHGCGSLTSFSANLSSLKDTRLFGENTVLADVQMIVPNALSAKTASDFGISGCPATAYTYVDTIDENLVRLVFTSTQRT